MSYITEDSHKFVHLTTAATTTVKSGAGMLKRVVINLGTGTLITMYDNTAASGTVIGIINPPATNTFVEPRAVEYDINFSTGLTIVTTGTWDLTIVYT